MDRDQLRALQAPLKEQYKTEPDAALITLSAKGSLYVTRPNLVTYTAQRADLDKVAADLFDVVGKGAVKIEADKPLRGGDAEPGGLFGDASKQTDLIDAIAVALRTDGQDVRFISREAALEEANKPADYANIVKD